MKSDVARIYHRQVDDLQRASDRMCRPPNFVNSDCASLFIVDVDRAIERDGHICAGRGDGLHY